MKDVRIKMLFSRDGRKKGTTHDVPEDVAKRHFAMAEAVPVRSSPETTRAGARPGGDETESATARAPAAKKKKAAKKKANSKK